jgi:hypothetical protein
MKLSIVDERKFQKDEFRAKEWLAAIIINALKISLKNLKRSVTSASQASTASSVFM